LGYVGMELGFTV